MPYSKFIDYWDYSSNWSLYIHPLDVSVNCPSSIEKDTEFNVIATINYSIPIYAIDPLLYNLTSCNATINLPSGLSLTPKENATKILNNGSLPAGDIASIQWEVIGNEIGANGPIILIIDGLVNRSTHTHTHSPYPGYNYTDLIKGIGTSNILVRNITLFIPHNRNNDNNNEIFEKENIDNLLIFFTVIGSSAAICIGIITIIMFKRKKNLIKPIILKKKANKS